MSALGIGAILCSEWLSPGVHIVPVDNPAGRGGGDTCASSSVYVEYRDAVLGPGLAGSNDLLWPIETG